MRKMKTFLLYASIVIFLAFNWSCKRSTSETFVSNEDFLHPQKETRVHTWWHWIQGSITKEGITKDLQTMKAQGIVQATILNVGLVKDQSYQGVTKVKFGSDQWFDMFLWALKEANRLDITIGTHNCDGWSSSGGPWIKPEQSMKMFTWSKTFIEGGKNISLKLEQPFGKDNFYKDVAVIAYPTNKSMNSFDLSNPEIRINDTINGHYLYDGCPISDYVVYKGSAITVKFTNSFKATKICILPKQVFSWTDLSKAKSSYLLSTSDNGKTYKKVKEFDIIGVNKMYEISFSATSSKYYKLEIMDDGNKESWLPFSIAEMELLQKDESPRYQPNIPFHLDKVIAVKPGDKKNLDFAGERSILCYS